MRSSLNGILKKSAHQICAHNQISSPGLIGHLKNNFPAMHRLFQLLKDRTEPPNEDEKAIAAGRKSLDSTTAAEYLKQLENASTNIVDLFNRQHRQTAVSHFHGSHL